MAGIGTLANVIGIVLGGLVGMVGKKLISKNMQDTLMKAAGLCVLFIGLSGALANLLTITSDGKLDTQGTMVMIASFTIGSIVGELLNIEKHFEDFGIWLKKKSGSENDNSFVGAFLTASFTVVIGAMAIVGAIQDGMLGDPSILYTKSILDALIIAVMAATMGKGCLFSAIPVGIWQWGFTFLAVFLEPLMTETALANISLTGSILIFCVGANLIRPRMFKVANMLPTIFVAVALGIFL